MADDLTKLVFEIEQRGAADVESRFRNIEGSLAGALKQYQKMSSEADGSTKKMFTNAGAIKEQLTTLEKGIVSAGKAYGGMFSGGKIRKQEQRLRGLQKEYDKINQTMTAGDEQQKKAAQSRMTDLKKAIDFEAAQTTKVFQKHKQEFDKIVASEKKTIGDLTKEGLGGVRGLVGDVAGGDFKSVGQRLGGGVSELGQQVGKRGSDMEMAGGNAKMAKLLKTFAKVAIPIAAIVGPLGALVAAFVALDGKVTETNKSMLANISLVEMAGTQYTNTKDQIADAEEAMAQFRDTAMTDMNLRMLGLDEKEMGQILATMNEQGMLLGDLREQGVGYSEALEVAQVAALNLGVDASETAGLIGTLADVTSQSFDEAAASLSQIVSFAQEAGINTKKFFSVVQNVVGEMGLYNYRVTETAALFSKLSNIMDAKSAEEFTTQLGSAVKDMSALERTSLVVVNGLGMVAEMADKTQRRMEQSLDPEKMMSAFEKVGMAELFEKGDINEAMKSMTRTQRNALQSAISDVDQATGEEFRKYRNVLEANRNDVMAMSGVLADFALGDQIKLQVGDLEKKLGMPLENMNSVLAESQGVSESQLRMLKAMKSDLSGDLERLRMVDEEKFDELAEQMGYNVDRADVMNGKMDAFDLMSTMTEKKQSELIDEQKDQKTLAEKSAEMQRSMLDTMKYKLMDLVSGIYKAILDIHSAIMKWGFEEEDVGGELRREALNREFDLRRESRKVAQMQPGDAKVRAEAELERKRNDIAAQQKRIQATEGMDAVTIGGRNRDRRKTVEMMGQYGVTSITDLERLVQARNKRRGTLRDTVGKDLASRGAKPYVVNGKATVLTPEQAAERRKTAASVYEPTGPSGHRTMQQYIASKAERLMGAEEAGSAQASKDIESALKDGSVTDKEIKKLQQDQINLFESKGIKLAPDVAGSLAKAIVDEQLKAQIRKDVLKAGFSRGQAAQLTDLLMSGDSAGLEEFGAGLGKGQKGQAKNLMSKYVPTVAKDAKIMTSGVPMLDLQAGDIIVDQESLASTLAGGKGDYVPELVRKAGGRGGGGGLNATFNIYGGNTSEIRQTILKVLQEWERKRSMS